MFRNESNIKPFLDIFMKPTPQVSSNQRQSQCDDQIRRPQSNFPLTDCSFKSTVKAGGGSHTSLEKASEISRLRMFRKISSEFFSAESSRNYVTELLFFALITGLSGWSIVWMIAVLTHTFK